MFESGIVQLIQSYVVNHPELALATIVTISRAIFKPFCALIIAGVEASPSTRDDQMLADLRENPWAQKALWLIDLVFSIKLPEIKKVDEPAKPVG